MAWSGQDRGEPARVVAEHRGAYDLAGPSGFSTARISGRTRRAASGPLELPAVGDWVVVEVGDGDAEILSILERTSALVRRAAGDNAVPQVVAANVDTVVICTSLDDDCNPRRLERYLALVHDSGADPHIALTKLDLCPDPKPYLDTVADVAVGVPVSLVSPVTGDGMGDFRALLGGNRTVALVGSSGVGKSTILNELLGEDRQEVAELTQRGRGRHTTVRRELVTVPTGGLLLDTPGMRELRLWDGEEGVLAAFPEIRGYVTDCRFSDCRHRGEPGCAVAEAVESGDLDPERVGSLLALLEEVEETRADLEEIRRRRG